MNQLERDASRRRSNYRRHRLIATDGVFSMDGDHRQRLDEICDLAETYDAPW